MSQAVYRELHPPTAVTHCVEAYFTHPAPAGSNDRGATAAAAVPPNLIVARGTRLEVYALNYGPGPCLGSSSSSSAAAASSSNSGSSSGPCRLELVGSYPCWGVICGLSVLRGKGSSGQRDSIVLAVRDAKLSVVEWNPDLHCLKNGSLHSYEKPELREGCPAASSIGAGSSLVSVPPLVATDPAGRCAAALLHGRLLAVLPAIQADALELLVAAQDKEGGGGAGAAGRPGSAVVGNSYTVNLAKVPSLRLTSATAVRAMAFMHGFTEPLLVLLHETTPTWGGRLKETRDACALSALSINVRKKSQPLIWGVPGLPSDACGLMAVPRGGVLVISQNLLMYYAQGGSCVMAINSNAFAGEVPPKLDPPSAPALPQYIRGDADKLLQAASQAALEKAVSAATSHAKQWAANVHPDTVPSAARGAPKAPGLELEADGAVGCWVEDTVALLSLKTGQLLLVSLRFEGTAASKMQVAVVGSAPVASCAVRLSPGLLFLGSTVGDSLLVRATRERAAAAGGKAAAAAAAAAAAGAAAAADHPASKRRRLASLASLDMGGFEGTPGFLSGRSLLTSACGGAGGSALSSSSSPSAAAAAGVDWEEGQCVIYGEWELYKSATGRSSSMKLPALLGDSSSKYSFQVLDSLLCLGPIRSSIITDLHLRESDVHASLAGLSKGTDSSPSPCLLAAVGGDKSGALAILRRGVVGDVITAVPGLGAHGAWTLHYRPAAAAAAAAAGGGAVDGVAAEGEGEAAAVEAAAGGGQGGEGDQQGEGGGSDTAAAVTVTAAAAAADGSAEGVGGSTPAAADDKKPAAAAALTEAGAGGAAVDREPPAAAAAAAAAEDADADAAVGDVGSSHHAFLLLSCGGSQTMVLDARGTELAEVTTDVAFIRSAPTIAVGEVFSASAAVQVTHHTVRLVSGTADLLQELTLGDLLAQANHPAAAAVAAAVSAAAAAAGSSDGSSELALKSPVCIKFAQVRDPYVLLMLSDSTVLLLQGYHEQQQQQQQRLRRLRLLRDALPQLAEAGWSVPQAAATAACLYTDSSGWLAAAVGLGVTPEGGSREQQQQQGGDVAMDEPEAASASAAVAGEQGKEGTAAAFPAAEDVQMADADAPAVKQEQQQQQQRASPGAADGSDASKPPAAAATAAAAAAVSKVAAAPTRMIPGLQIPAPAPTAPPAAAAAAAGGLDDDGDGVAPASEVAAAEAAQTAAAEGAAAADAAAAADGATAKGRAVAGSKAFDAVVEAAAAAAAAEGGDSGDTKQQQQQLATADSLKTPLQAAAATVLEDTAVAMDTDSAPAAAAADGGQAGAQQQQQQRVVVHSFVVVVRAGGGLQVFALPHMQCVFEDGEALLGHQVLSPSRPPSLYEEEVTDAELSPSPISEVLLECFGGQSGGAAGVAAAAAPLLVLLREDGSILTYKAFKPLSSSLGFRQLPLGAALIGHEAPAPPPASSPAAAISGIAGMPGPATPPCRLIRFDRLATPRLDPPLGPGFRQPGLNPTPSAGAGSAAAAAAALGAGSGVGHGLPQLHYSGVLVCGPKPLWLVAARGGFVVHPMDSGLGAVHAFCGFHNVNCPHGYIAAALGGDMRICTLPLQLRLDQPWLTSKLPLRCTPLDVTAYPPAHLLALATSRLSAPPRPYLPAEPGGDPVTAAAYATADAAARAAGVEELSEVLLLAPPGFGLRMNTYVGVAGALAAAAAMAAAGSSAAGGGGSAAAEGGLLPTPSVGAGSGGTASSAAGSAARVAAAVAAAAGWAGLPLWRHSLLPGEDVTALKCVSLREEGDGSEQPYIAVGCASTFGEDYPALGRVLLLQVTKREVYDVEGTQTKISARLALQRELPGPVMAVESLRGFLILAVGFRLEMHYKQGNVLVKMGQFIDCPSLVTGISIVKDYMLVGTAGHGGRFLRYKEDVDRVTREKTQNMLLLSQDVSRVETWSVDFMANSTKLLQVLADGGGNLSVMQYDKQDPESWDGQKLLRRGAAHTGCWVTGLARMTLATLDGSKRQGLLGSTAQGGLLLLSPFWDEAMFRRMTSLYEELVYRLQHTAGLNPKAFTSRFTRAGPAYGAGFYPKEPLKPSNNSLLQGDVLWAFLDLDARAQAAIAMAVGCDAGDLVRDLQQLTVVANLL